MMMPIFDAHTHAFPDAVAPGAMKTLLGEAKWHPVQAYHDGTLRGLLASMDAAGIQRAIMCSVATRPTQVKKITDWSASIASDRIIPFASIHPDYDQPEAEIERLAQLGIKGLKAHPQYMQCAVDDPRMIRIAKAAAQAGLALTIHAGHDLAFERNELGSPQSLRRLHEAVPDLRLLGCHLGGWRRWDEVLDHVVGQPIYLDTSFCLGQCPPQLLERIISHHPAEYLLFGTDSPWSDQQADLAAFVALPISEEARRQAMWDNVHRFVGLGPPD